MAGTRRTILDNFAATAVKTQINTERTTTPYALGSLQAWQSELPTLPPDPNAWEEWTLQVPYPWGAVVLEEEFPGEAAETGGERLTATVYVVLGIASNDRFTLQQHVLDTLDTTIKAVEVALRATYFKKTDGSYPVAFSRGGLYVPFGQMLADSEIGMCITIWEVHAFRDLEGL